MRVVSFFFTKIGCEQVRNAVLIMASGWVRHHDQLACLLQVNPGLHKGSEVSGVLIRLPALCLSNPINCFFPRSMKLLVSGHTSCFDQSLSLPDIPEADHQALLFPLHGTVFHF